MPQPRIVIPKLVFEKIMHMVMKADKDEVSGLGVTEIVGSDIIVRDILMAKQKNGSASTDMEGEDIASLMYRFHVLHPDLPVNYWWHSHVDMSVFLSSVDRATVAQIAGDGMCVAQVFNKRKEICSAIASNNPFPFMLENVKTEIEPVTIPDALINSWNQEFEDNVSKYVYTPTSSFGLGAWNDSEWERSDSGCYVRKGNADWDKAVPVKKEEAPYLGSLADLEQRQNEEEWSVWMWAENRPEIDDYNIHTGEFILGSGTRVDARLYIEKCKEYEQKLETEKRQ